MQFQFDAANAAFFAIAHDIEPQEKQQVMHLPELYASQAILFACTMTPS